MSTSVLVNIRNKTVVATEELRKLVEFADPGGLLIDIAFFSVELPGTSFHYGYGHAHGQYLPSSHRIHIKIPDEDPDRRLKSPPTPAAVRTPSEQELFEKESEQTWRAVKAMWNDYAMERIASGKRVRQSKLARQFVNQVKDQNLHSLRRWSRTEDVLYFIAHELRHQQQHEQCGLQMVYGAFKEFSERDADAYAMQTVRRWRRRGSPFFGPAGEVSDFHE